MSPSLRGSWRLAVGGWQRSWQANSKWQKSNFKRSYQNNESITLGKLAVCSWRLATLLASKFQIAKIKFQTPFLNNESNASGMLAVCSWQSSWQSKFQMAIIK